ncbi:hypothetical protein K7432_003495 [Basidiobolus ranarum]|uniref:Uncharacterized protein n=1 Tax=Basidiobolus ranarum TaxID=34480 RepID=A0ABR2WZX2_9FUNG
MSKFLSRVGNQIDVLQRRLESGNKPTVQFSPLPDSPPEEFSTSVADDLPPGRRKDLKYRRKRRQNTLLSLFGINPDREKLGTFEGVFVPVCLSIWGIMLFVRQGYIIGQAGLVETFVMFIVGYLIAYFTTLSISAISANGTVRGGGPYYLISRSLGPEFGGSIGLVFWVGTILGGVINLLAFVQPLISTFGEQQGAMLNVLPEGKWCNFFYSSVLLLCCTGVCLIGSKLFARTSIFLSFIILVSTLIIFLSFFIRSPFTDIDNDIEYTGLSMETLKENLWPGYLPSAENPDKVENYQSIFALVFPCFVGIMAGTSMSGNLRKPSKSIPKGTLAAVVVTFMLYMIINIMLAASTTKETLVKRLSILQDISVLPIMVVAGAFATATFATLSALISSAKILQAIARDHLIPILSLFDQGTDRSDDPTYAIIFSYILIQLLLFTGSIGIVAPYFTILTILTFGITNLACFLLKIGSAPNFRPSFHHFKWYTGLIGVSLCFTTIFIIDPLLATLSTAFMSIMFGVIHYTTLPKSWGDVTQSLIYHQVRKYLLRLDTRKEHVKFWRPQILLLVNNPRSNYHLIQFCNSLKKGSLYILGHILKGDFRTNLNEFRKQQNVWLKFVDITQIKAFVQLTISDSERFGARNLIVGSGLGGMRPNIVVLGFFNSSSQEISQNTKKKHVSIPIVGSLPTDRNRKETPISITDYVSIIEDTLALNKAVAIAHGFSNLRDLPPLDDNSNLFSTHTDHKSRKKYIDMWPIQLSIPSAYNENGYLTNFDTYTMVLQMGCILHMVPYWKQSFILRVMCFVEHQRDVEEERRRVETLLENLRVEAELHVFWLDCEELTSYSAIVKGKHISNKNDHLEQSSQQNGTIDEESGGMPIESSSSQYLRSSGKNFSQSSLSYSQSGVVGMKINVPIPERGDDHLSEDSDLSDIEDIEEEQTHSVPPSTTGSVATSNYSSTEFNDLPPHAQNIILNELMRLRSKDTSILFTSLPAPDAGTCEDQEKCEYYMGDLKLLVKDLPPTFLIHAKSMTVTTHL